MKKALSLLLVAVMLLGLVPVAYATEDNETPIGYTDTGANLLIGGDFNSAAYGVGNFVKDYETTRLEYVSGGGVDGSGCIALYPSAASGNICMRYNDGDGWAMPLLAGHTYTMTFKMLNPSTNTGSWQWCNMGIEGFERVGGQEVALTYAYLPGEARDQWITRSKTFTVPNNPSNTNLRIYCSYSGVSANDKIYFDDLSIVDVTPVSANLVGFGDFESETVFKNSDGHWPAGGASYSLVSGMGVDGSDCLQINLAQNANNSFYTWVDCVPGKTYVLSYDIKAANGLVSWANMDVEGDGTNAWVNGTLTPFSKVIPDTWTTITSIIRVPSGFSMNNGQMPVRIMVHTNASAGGTAWIDNLSVRCDDPTVQSRYKATYNEDIKGVNLLYNGDCNREGYNWGRADWKGAAFTWRTNEGVDGSGAWVGVAGDASQSGCVMAMPAGTGKQTEAYRLYEISVDVWRSADCNASTRLELKLADETWLGWASFATKYGEWETLTYKYWSGGNPKNLAAMVITDAGYTTGTVKVDNFAMRELGVVERFDIVDLESAVLTEIKNNVATVELTFGAPMWIGGNVLLCDSKNTSGCNVAKPEQYQYTTVSLGAVNGVVQGEKTYSTKWVATFNLCGCEQHPELWSYGLPGDCVVRITDWMGSAEDTQNGTLDERMVIAANVAEGSNGERVAAEYIDAGMDAAWVSVINEAPEWAVAGDNLVRSGDFLYEWYTGKDFYPAYGTTEMKWYAEGGMDNSSYVGMVMHEPSDGNEFACLQYRLDGGASVELVKDQWYILSCDVYIPTGAADWVAIDFETDAWNNWAIEPIANGYVNRVSTQNSWQHLYMKFKYTDETAVHMLRILAPARTAGLEVKIDNVSLRCLSDPTIKPAFEPLPDDLDPNDFPTGTLEMVSAEVISDVEGIITFSEPAVFEEWCFFAVRFLDERDWLVWRTPDGEYSATGYEIEGSTPMQWVCSWEWYNEEHTQIRFKILGDGTDDMYNFNDLFAVDWASLIEGGYLAIGFEELGEIMVNSNGYVDNIRLASDPRVALTATRRADRDSAWVKMDVKYTPKKLTYSAKILNETQIRITFSEPVTIKSNPHIAIRYTDDDNVMIYNEDNYNRFGLQFNGTWEKESSTSYIWTIDGHTHYNTRTLYDVVNFTGGLSQFWKANVRVCIEELDSATFKSGNNNNVVENIATLDGANHLRGNRRSGYDGAYVDLKASALKGDKLTILSAVALNETQVEVTFSSSVSIAEGASMSVRYLTPSGDSETLVDGRTASFKGDWEYKDDDKTVIIWTMNSKHADKLSDIINFNGNFKWNKGSRVAFTIVDDEEDQAPRFSMRIKGVTTSDGYMLLEANYAKKEFMMAHIDLQIEYDVPEPIIQNEEPEDVAYVTDYLPFGIGAAAMVVGGVIGMIVLITVRKKEGN